MCNLVFLCILLLALILSVVALISGETGRRRLGTERSGPPVTGRTDPETARSARSASSASPPRPTSHHLGVVGEEEEEVAVVLAVPPTLPRKPGGPVSV